jgi:hypothetical protein
MSKASYGDLMLVGRSGQKYCFHTWSYSTRFRDLGAVFFVTRRHFTNGTYHRASHEMIYIGQTASLAAALGNPGQLAAFEKHGANCIGVRAASDAADRTNIVEDLMAVQRPPMPA